jgi:hypothetical protein
VKYLVELFVVVCWLAGIVLAHGFWSVLLAVLFPPWGWYLLVERGMAMLGVTG